MSLFLNNKSRGYTVHQNSIESIRKEKPILIIVRLIYFLILVAAARFSLLRGCETENDR